MNAYTRSTLALLLLLLTGSTLTTASAQPADPTLHGDTFTLDTIERTLANPATRAALTARQWQAYSRQLTGALASGHDGLQQGALRMIIQYGDDLAFERPAVFDVVRIYRDHANDNLRRMAVVALGQMHDAWALDFLKRSVRFERTPSVRYTILSVLDEHGTLKLGPAKSSN